MKKDYPLLKPKVNFNMKELSVEEFGERSSPRADFPPMVELALALLQRLRLFFLVCLLESGSDLYP